MDILRSLLDANPNIYLVGLVLIVAIVVKSFVGQSGKGARDNYSLNNYTLVPSVMTKAEMTFYLSLISTVGDKYTVMVKVRLADIITVKKSSTNYMAHFGKIKAKEGANKRGNSSRLTQSFHFFMFEPIFSPVNALNQPI